MAIETNMDDCEIRNRLNFLGFTATDDGPFRSFKSSFWKPEPGVSFNVNDLLPGDRTNYWYPGSLTTPPCSESVQWMVLKNAMTMVAEQAQVFEGIIG